MEKKTVPTNYNKIATEFEKSTQLDVRKYIEEPSFFQLAPEFKEKRVLDLACGEGRYTRKIKEKGALQVIGVDASETLIALAQKKETENPKEVTYLCKDVAKLGVISSGNFDVVTAVYLLNNAASIDLLTYFCNAIYSNLKSGGIFVSINCNFHIPVELYGTYKKYDIYMSTDIPRKEGMPTRFTLSNQDGTFVSLDAYYLSPKTYEDVFKKVGFTNFKWEAVTVTPEGVIAMDDGYWDHFIAHPTMIGISAKKP